MLLPIELLVFPSSYFLSRRTREMDFLGFGFAINLSHRRNRPARLNGPRAVFAFRYG
jgi:hypothetical protein